MFARGKGKNIFHFCSNCGDFPDEVEEIKSEQVPDNKVCEECKKRSKRGRCTPYSPKSR